MVAFEPGPETVERLRRNVRLNHLDNVQIEHAAVGESNGVIEFHIAADSAYSGFQADPHRHRANASRSR